MILLWQVRSINVYLGIHFIFEVYNIFKKMIHLMEE